MCGKAGVGIGGGGGDGELYTLHKFSAIFYKGNNFVSSCLRSCISNPF